MAASIVAGAQTSPWESEVVYQIFPRSFADSNGDHIGDFRGISNKLGYLQELGVTALLINPIQASRFYHNYFADDFYRTDPTLGTNADFFRMVLQAHSRHMKVILDMEVQYIADKHPWFKDFERDPNSRYKELIWREGSALFGAKLPTYDGRKIGYATLNPSSTQLRDEISNVFRYWAAPDGNPAHGVDGFRIDHMMDDLDGQHVKTGMLENFWSPIEASVRRLTPQAFFVGEQADWGQGRDLYQKGHVDSVYAMSLWYAWSTLDAAKIEKALNNLSKSTPGGKTQFLFIENHDVKRYASLVHRDPALLRLGAAMEFTAKGTPMIYYGQELGMAGIQGSWKSDANDIPVRLAFRWTRKVGGKESADFYRNSGPWDSKEFTRDNDGVSLEEEAQDPNSLFYLYKRLIRLRRMTPALRQGTQFPFPTLNPDVVGYVRAEGRQQVLVLLNLSNRAQPMPLPLDLVGLTDLLTGKRVRPEKHFLKPHGFSILQFSRTSALGKAGKT